MLTETRQPLSIPMRVHAPNERLLIWQKAAGAWKGRGGKMLRELRRLRSAWDKHIS